jgi:hypothetical protein
MKIHRILFQGSFFVTTLLAFVVVGSPSVASAQSASAEHPELNQKAADCESPEGSWLYTVTIPGGYTFQGIETYAAGGGYVEADQLSFSMGSVASAGHGAWKMTGERTFLLTYINLTFQDFSSGAPTGTLKVRQTTKLSKDGETYTGSGDYTYYDLSGNPLPAISGTFTITAKRIEVEAPAKD